MNQLELFINESGGIALLIIFVLLIWTTVWKGIALWKSARLGSKWWFIILLIVNTVGILELLYIFVISKEKTDKKETIENEE